ncbi:unnamed protein product, partial [Iphiclides podalirius]
MLFRRWRARRAGSKVDRSLRGTEGGRGDSPALAAPPHPCAPTTTCYVIKIAKCGRLATRQHSREGWYLTRGSIANKASKNVCFLYSMWNTLGTRLLLMAPFQYTDF